MSEKCSVCGKYECEHKADQKRLPVAQVCAYCDVELVYNEDEYQFECPKCGRINPLRKRVVVK